MSMDALRWAMAQTLPTTQKMVLVTLAFHINIRTDLCNPGVALIQRESGLKSRRTVQDCLRQLQKAGLIEIRSDSEGGRGNKTSYFLCYQKGAAETPLKARPSHKGRNSRQERAHLTARKGAFHDTPYKEGIEPNRTRDVEPELHQNTSASLQYSDGSASKFKQQKIQLRNVVNKVAFLSEVWKELFPGGADENESIFPLIGGILNTADRDAELVHELMWNSASRPIRGDPIAYLHGAVFKEMEKRRGGGRDRYGMTQGNRY